MKLVWGATSHVGMLRQQNEDAFVAQPEVFVVADGMGGHNAGEVASALAVRGMQDAAGGGFVSAEGVVAAINAANAVIHAASGGPTDQRGMGTTLTAVAPLPAVDGEPQRVVVANVGDSRVYLWRGGELRQVSADHSYVQELLTEGYISAEEARVHPRRNIVTRALGIEGDVNADSWVLPMVVGDRYVLCSDGLVDEVSDEQIAALLREHSEPQAAANRLVEAANTNGGRDNTTVIVVDVVDDSAVATTAPVAPATPKRGKAKWLAVAAGVVVLVAASLGAIGWYARGGYFVGFDGKGDDAALVVFKGRSPQVLWFAPTVHLDSGVKRSEVFPALAADIDEHPAYPSPARAVAYVNSIRGVVEEQRDDGAGS
jgi:protein phosphatase